MTSKSWYNLSVAQTEKELNTSQTDGLTKRETARRLAKYRKNRIFPLPTGTFSSYLRQVLSDFTSLLLLLTALLSLLFGQKVNAGVILALLAVHYGAAVLVYVRAQRVLEDMESHALPNVKVMRGGRLYIVKQEDLVPGDVIFLSVGDIVPADCRLAHSENLTVLEGKLTGERHSVYKDADFSAYGEVPLPHRQNMVYAATIVTGGTAKAIVCATGDDTEVCIQGKNPPLVSQEKLRVIAVFRKYCSVWSLCMIAVIFLLTVTDLFIGYSDRGLFDIFLTGLTLAVASMSEMYAAFGYIVIATGIFSAMRQKKDTNEGALIKNSGKLAAIKDLNCLIFPREATYVAQNSQIDRIFYNGTLLDAKKPNQAKQGAQLIRYAVLSSGIYGARALVTKNESHENVYTPEQETIIGMAARMGVYNVTLEQEYRLLDHVDAGSRSRYDTSLVSSHGNQISVVRGDAAEILSLCRYCNENGKSMPLAGDRLNRIMTTVAQLSKETLRVVAVATRATSNVNLSRIRSNQTDLTFEGLIAFREPLLPDAARNLSKCKNAGIHMIMTCDAFSETNIRMAESLGIITSRDEVLDSYRMSAMKPEILRINVRQYRLLLGLSTSQKEEFLQYLQADGFRVGMICRQLNEAKLLRIADVSFSQNVTISHRSDRPNRALPVFVKDDRSGNRAGCEAIKYLADVVIAQPSQSGRGGLNAMLSAVGAAKVIYLNLLRMARYLIVSQISKFLIVLFGILTRTPILDPTQILFTGIIADFCAVLVIAFERPGRNILSAREETEEKLRHPLTANAPCFVLGVLLAALCVTAQFLPVTLTGLYNASLFGTAVFYAFLISQIVILSEMKTEKSLFRGDITMNAMFAFLLAAAVSFILLCQRQSGFAALFSVTPLNARQFTVVLGIPAIFLFLCEAVKLIMRLTDLTDAEKAERSRRRAEKKRLRDERRKQSGKSPSDTAKRRSLWNYEPEQDEEPVSTSDAALSDALPSAKTDDSSDTAPADGLSVNQKSDSDRQNAAPVVSEADSEPALGGPIIDTDAFDEAKASGMDPETARETTEMMLSLYGSDGSFDESAEKKSDPRRGNRS